MEVHLDSPNKLKQYICTKVLITRPSFELQNPYFARKFIVTVQQNDQVQKYINTKVQEYNCTKQENAKIQKM